MVVILPELRNILQRDGELIQKDKLVVLMSEGGKSSKSNFKNKKRKFGNEKSPKQSQAGKGKIVKTDKSGDACHYSGKSGYWK